MPYLRMHRIDHPDWAAHCTQYVSEDFDFRVLKAITQQAAFIEKIVVSAIDDYIAAETESSAFPLKRRMSGEYYLSNSAFWAAMPDSHEQNSGQIKQYRFSVMVHCLEKPEYVPGPDLDYLGLEVHFSWDSQNQTIVFHGDVDSSSI
jgi:hypothetical protein